MCPCLDDTNKSHVPPSLKVQNSPHAYVPGTVDLPVQPSTTRRQRSNIMQAVTSRVVDPHAQRRADNRPVDLYRRRVPKKGHLPPTSDDPIILNKGHREAQPIGLSLNNTFPGAFHGWNRLIAVTRRQRE